ncbi:hypothetical protein IFM89_015733 [Coptis chinensis]|uniref:Pentatricopeptide repeat-containing protein n=1 Tax=Coptis chinensis TaxID=261450 RepID=A0A835I3G2_9MAGN|nr:hypothetical protein IFM89_015733 [Coptis chinensis]
MVEECIGPSFITYSTLVNGICKHGDMEMSLKFLDQMIEAGVHPNMVTYCTTLQDYIKRGDAQQISQLFNKLWADTYTGLTLVQSFYWTFAHSTYRVYAANLSVAVFSYSPLCSSKMNSLLVELNTNMGNEESFNTDGIPFLLNVPSFFMLWAEGICVGDEGMLDAYNMSAAVG